MRAVRLSPEYTAKVLSVVVLALVALSTAGQISTYYFGHGRVFGLVRLFSLTEESNVPSWYASVTLLACSLLLAVIALGERAKRGAWFRHWAALSVIFLYLSVDEAAQIHELSIEPLHALIGLGGLLRWAWVIPGMVLVVVLALSYSKFIAALPDAIRRLFVASAALFVGGALIVEMLSGWWFERHGRENMGQVLLWTTEETLEMAGVAVFLYSLLRYLRDYGAPLRVSFDGS